MSDVRVCEDRTLALWKADGREGTAVKGPVCLLGFRCKTRERERDFNCSGPRKLRSGSLAGEHLVFVSTEPARGSFTHFKTSSAYCTILSV